MLYLEIEKIRFEDRPTVKFTTVPQTKALFVPNLLLQPLVENSIKYVVAQMPNGGLIKVTTKCQRGYLQMEVADNGPAKNQVSIVVKPIIEGQTASIHTGVGGQNIVDRLNALYPNNHNFKIVRGVSEGYCVIISIPMEHL